MLSPVEGLKASLLTFLYKFLILLHPLLLLFILIFCFLRVFLLIPLATKPRFGLYKLKTH